MKKVIFKWLSRMVATCATSVVAMSAMAESVEVTTPGTLSTVLSSSATDVAISGSINGSDVKYLRQMINEGNLTSVDLSKTAFASGGDAYYGEFTTKDGEMPEAMFTECSNLESITLPTSVKHISKNACSKTGLTNVVIPDNITSLGMDAFAYCKKLETVTLGKRVSSFGQGVFWSSSVKDVYIKSQYIPSFGIYLFSTSPTIHVFKSMYSDYSESKWNSFGAIIADIEDIADEDSAVHQLFMGYFENNACTSLKVEYAGMSDAAFISVLNADGIPADLVDVALKIKNDNWAAYEKEFRINSYSAFSDANYWHDRLLIHGGSYMGNPTGIYCATDGYLYVFVDQDTPSDASLFICGKTRNNLINDAKSGIKLKKGLNKIEGEKDAIYYILYTANTSSMTKRVSEWPSVKIHIEGGVVNGYYDISRHSAADYRAILEKATYDKFTVKGQYTAMNFNTSSYRSFWPDSIDRSVARFDSLVLREYYLMGITEFVANGGRAEAPYFVEGGESFFPGYYNNLHWAIEDTVYSPGVPADASYYRTAYFSPENVNKYFNVEREGFAPWCVAHEFGHTNQKAINLEGCTEVSNNLFSNVNNFLEGRTMTSGYPLSATMDDYAYHVPYWGRNIWSMTRMYYQLYLYYHQAQHNTSFYPELFKALREDPIQKDGNTKNSSLKFVRKVCEIVQEDLTDFFKAWGFFEPVDTVINDYGEVHILNEQAEIDATLAEIAKYPKKNRQILFIEDRIEYLKTTDFLTIAGQNRLDSDDKVGSCGDLGQFTDYLPGAGIAPSYVYAQANNVFGMEGTGGVGFIVLDENGELLYASNNKSFELTAEVMNKNFVIKAVDAEGNLYDVPKVDGGSVNITLTEAGTLCEQLNTLIVKAKISGPLNGSDVKCLRQKINQESLTYLDLSEATFVTGGDSYYNGYNTTEGKIGYDMFAYCTKLTHLVLPNEVERINSRACQYSGLTNVVIPDSVAFVESYAFDNSFNMRTATIGEGVTSLGWGSFGGTKLKNIYVKPLTPPSLADYVFSTDSASLFIHVYKEAYEDYVASKWSKYGVIVADLDELEKHDTIIDIDEVACDELLKNVEVMSWGGTLVDVPIHDKNGEEISIKFYDSANTLQAAYPDYAETQLMNGPIGEEDAYVHHLCLYQTAGLSYGQEYRIAAMVGDKNCDARFSLEKGIYTASQARTAEDEGIRYVSATQSEIYVEFVSDSDSDAEISYYSTSGRQSGSKSVKVQKGVNSLAVDAQNILPNNSYVLNLSKEGVKYGKTFIVK